MRRGGRDAASSRAPRWRGRRSIRPRGHRTAIPRMHAGRSRSTRTPRTRDRGPRDRPPTAAAESNGVWLSAWRYSFSDFDSTMHGVGRDDEGRDRDVGPPVRIEPGEFVRGPEVGTRKGARRRDRARRVAAPARSRTAVPGRTARRTERACRAGSPRLGHGSILPRQLEPAPVADRLGDVGRGDRFRAGEVGDGAGDFEDAVVGARREPEAARSPARAASRPAGSGAAVAIDFARAELARWPCLAARAGARGRRRHALAHGGARSPAARQRARHTAPPAPRRGGRCGRAADRRAARGSARPGRACSGTAARMCPR